VQTKREEFFLVSLFFGVFFSSSIFPPFDAKSAQQHLWDGGNGIELDKAETDWKAKET